MFKKSLLAAIIACAIVITVGFSFAPQTARAQTAAASAATISIEQLQQMVLNLQKMIAQVLQLIAQMHQQPSLTVCGNGKCETGETAASCPADCGIANKLKCSANSDCGESCGYGCVNKEWAKSQPQLKCIMAPVATGYYPIACICGNGGCVETSGASALKLTCGDGICESGETATNCPADCKTNNTVSPMISGLSPSGIIYNGSAVLAATTDDLARCRYSSSDKSFDSMEQQFGSADGLSHSAPVTLTNFGNYTYYVRCAGLSGNANQNSSKISFDYLSSATKSCGNGTCDTANGETAANCSQDCKPVVGGSCTYKYFSGKCTITSVSNLNDDSSAIVGYTFTPNLAVDVTGTFLTSPSQINPYKGTTNVESGPSPLIQGTTVACTLSVITSGTCTPIIIKMPLPLPG